MLGMTTVLDSVLRGKLFNDTVYFLKQFARINVTCLDV